MGLFSTLTIFLAALLHGDFPLALATLPLAGSLLGFLRYNFNPASVFLGDSGSLLIGFLLGCYGVIWSQKSATMLGMTAPLMAMAIPLLDVSLSIVRRWLRGQPIFTGDRSHIHHKLLEKGLTHRGVVILLYGVCGVYALLSLVQSFEYRLSGLVLVLFCSVTWIGVQQLGYFEFGLAGRTLFGGGLRRMVNGQIVLHGLDHALDAAPDEPGCWEALRQTLAGVGFTNMQARLNGREFRQSGPANDPCWQLRIPLPGGDYLNLERSFDKPVPTVMVGPLVDMLHRRLPGRLAALAGQPSNEALSLARLAARVDSFESGPQAIPPPLPQTRRPHPVG
jgi:UDP-GlcNAc:undecaprenyl-phosphate/decaprenyl-phosphate GlcNAc-1-phosphate transferase